MTAKKSRLEEGEKTGQEEKDKIIKFDNLRTLWYFIL